MKVGIYLFEQFHGRSGVGSSRIRGHWIANNWPEAEIYVTGRDYDVMIYQKVYHIEHARSFKGFKILDLCDPDWLHWGYKTKEMIEEVDAVTTSSEMLRLAVKQFTDKPVVCIPDRIDLSLFDKKKVHEGDAKSAVWFGYSDNYEVLDQVVLPLKKAKLDLVVVSDGLYAVPSVFQKDVSVTNYKWKDEFAYANIITGDIALNPRKTSGKWKFKSDNKTFLAWALGLPVATDASELKRFISCEERIKEVELRTKELQDKWDIKYSIQQFKELINDNCNLEN